MINTNTAQKKAIATIVRNMKAATIRPLEWYMADRIIQPLESLLLYTVIDRRLLDEDEDQYFALT